MNTATICLGSNASDAAAHIDRAVALLGDISSIIKDSGAYLSDPEKSASTATYTNRILEIATEDSLDKLHSLCKAYESEQRATIIEENRVTIDIDIVAYNETILRPHDHASAYFRKGQALLS